MTAAGTPSSLLNKAETKRELVRIAQAEKYYFTTFNPRVSEATLLMLEAKMRVWMRAHVAGLPSKGRTI